MSEAKKCCCATGSCCSKEPVTPYDEKCPWITGVINTPEGDVPVISTALSAKDVLGAWKVRWGIGRMDYTVPPGLYAVGKPDAAAPVLVSANYKLTFDMLRKELTGLSCWVLILDTRGVNVWCAAGKGTFGTDELLNRITKTRLSGIVSHRTLILPQLGAPGICAHEVTRQSGFAVVYGPVRASDIKAYLQAGQKATEDMRTVKFTAWNRLVLTPMELVIAAEKSLLMLGVLFLINLFAARPFGLTDFMLYAGAVLTGTVVTPLLLPVIPGRAFAWKGWLMGMIWTAGCLLAIGWFSHGYWPLVVGYLLALPALSSFLAMNFTGSSTYTSFSGVMKEMQTAVPMIAVAVAAGVVLLLIGCLSA